MPKGESDTRRWTGKCVAVAWFAIGLGIFLGSLAATGGSTAGDSTTLDTVLPRTILGLLILGIGIYMLGAQGVGLLRLRWVEWILLLSLAGVVAIPVAVSKEPADTDVEVPIPAARLIGGKEPLLPGQVVELVVRAPDAQGTPTTQTLTDVEVRAFVGEAGDKSTVLIALPAQGARDLQQALLDDTSRLTYRLLPGTATATSEPEGTPTPTPTPITVRFSLEVTRIPPKSMDWSLEVLSDTNKVSVILVTESKDDEGKLLSHQAHKYDVGVVGVYTDTDGAKVIRVELPVADKEKVEQFAADLADIDRLYVIPLPTATPTLTPTATSAPGGG